MPKGRVLRAIDTKPALVAGAATADTTYNAAPPKAAIPPTVSGLALTTGLTLADRTASAYITATWQAGIGVAPDRYTIQWAEDAAFTVNVGGVTIQAPTDNTDPQVTIPALKAGTGYYVHVAAVYYSSVSAFSAAASITTAQDTTPPGQATSVSAAIGANGDLTVSGTNPSQANFAQVELTIRGSASGPTYAVLPISGQPGATFRAVWPAAENVRLAAGDGTLTVEVVSRSFAGYASAPVVVSATKAAPTAPTVAATWDAALGSLLFTGAYGAFETLTLTLDGTARGVTLPYTYSVALNKKEHGGVANAAVVWSAVATDPLNQASTATSGTATLARPATPASVTTTWDGASGTWTIAWAAVTGAASYTLTIDGVARTVADTRSSYSLGANRQEHAGTASPSLVWSLVAVDGLGQTSTAPAGGTSTLARPATPGSVITNFAASNATWSWGAVSAIVGYRLTVDGKAKDLQTTSYDYPFATNALEHSGTATPSLPWSLVAVDALGQTSTTPASGTLVNAAPGAPTAITVIGGATGLFVAITHPSTLDLRDYTVRIIKNGTTYETLTKTERGFAYPAPADGVYTIGVIVNDVFGQASSEYVTPSGTTVDLLTMSELRADAFYSDSVATSSTTLAGLKDDNRTTDVVTYASGTAWKWTEAKRSSSLRVGNIAITATAGTGYVGISDDGATYSWFSGPLAADGQTLTPVANEAAAQTAALSLPTTTSGVWSLPTTASARYIRLGHRNTAATYTLREFYPPTLVVADNIKVGLLRGFKVVANQLVVDELFAIQANTGAINLSGYATIGSAGGIWQGSAGTPTSPTTGYKLYLSGTGKGLWETWQGGVKQVYLDDADMGLAWAAGKGKLNASGLILYGVASGVTYDPGTAIRWFGPSSDERVRFLATTDNGPTTYGTTVYLEGYGAGSGATTTTLQLRAAGGTLAAPGTQQATIRAVASGSTNYIDLLTSAGSLRVSTTGTLISGSGAGDGSSTASAALQVSGTLSVSSSATVTGNVIGGGVRMGTVPTAPSGGALGIALNANTYYSVAADATDLYLNANGAGGSIIFRMGNNQRGYINANGDIILSSVMYLGNQTSNYMYYDSANAGYRSTGTLIANGDVFVGGLGWLRAGFLDQNVKTGASPTFASVASNAGISAKGLADFNADNQGTLGSTTGNAIDIGQFRAQTSNNVQLRVRAYRAAAGTDWTTAAMLIHRWTDSSSQSYISLFGDQVGIGVTNPVYKLELPNVASSAGQGRANAWVTYSSRRWKTDIAPIDAAGALIAQLQGVTYFSATEPSTKRDIGLIAEDVGAVVPELVDWEDDGIHAKSLKYDRIVALLINDNNDLRRRIERLEKGE